MAVGTIIRWHSNQEGKNNKLTNCINPLLIRSNPLHSDVLSKLCCDLNKNFTTKSRVSSKFFCVCFLKRVRNEGDLLPTALNRMLQFILLDFFPSMFLFKTIFLHDSGREGITKSYLVQNWCFQFPYITRLECCGGSRQKQSNRERSESKRPITCKVKRL